MQLAHDYDGFVSRLSRASVSKHFDAYEDVAWDAEENAIAVDDPRFVLDDDHPLGASDWYRNLPETTRARLGLHLFVCQFKVGMEFERVLQRGLLEIAELFKEGQPELRYIYHEVIEEAQHSLMFQEIIHRSGLEPFGMEGVVKAGSRTVPRLARRFPELFFIHVLSGEVPIDRVQRRVLAKRRDLHPLFRRVMQIHVTEEARHVAFARVYLTEHAPKLGWLKRIFLAYETPFVVQRTAKAMLEPPRRIVERYRIPGDVMRAAYRDNPVHRSDLQASIAPIRELAKDLGIANRRTSGLWKRLGIWA